jgi:transcriptional regulator with XRE-family HTH domain
MGEFARVLSEIIERGKQEKAFSIKELAQQAQITASYLSNLKQSNRKPPAHKTLLKLTDALRKSNVLEVDVQRLIDAYNRQHLNYQEKRNLLESLIDEYKAEGNLFERLKQGVQTKGLVLKKSAEKRKAVKRDLLHTELSEGDQHAFALKAIKLLEKAQDLECPGGKIYITWFHHDLLDEEFSRDREELRNTLRSFLWVNSPFRVLQLWAGDIVKEITVIVDFLAQYIGTSNCFLYEVPYSQHLPEYLVVEDVGFIEARPIADNRYWMRCVIADQQETQPATELKALIQYLEYLLGPQEIRKPLVQTNATLERFSVTPGISKLVEVEKHNLREEQLLIKSSLSARYRPVEYVRALLEAFGVPQDMRDLYAKHYLERVTVLEKRIESGKDRSIHEREFLKKEFKEILPSIMPDGSNPNVIQTLEANLLKGQILGVLRAIKRNPNIHFALADQEFLIRVTLSGDTVFFSFDPPGAQGELPFKRDDLLVRAWTNHPDVVYQLRHEFNAKWKEIDPQWRTDDAKGRQNVVNFFVTEPLKAMLNANVPGQELWSFTCELVDHAAYLDVESFTREVYTYEQVAKEIFIMSNNFPLITMPVDIGPWGPRSSIRTRQILFYALLQTIQRIHLMIPQKSSEEYWETGQYETYAFNREWITQHFQYLHDLLLKFPDKITLEIIPQQERFPVNFEVINGEWVLFQKAHIIDAKQGGLVLHDKELAEQLITYIARNLSSKCPKHLKGPKNVMKWFEERFGVKALENLRS